VSICRGPETHITFNKTIPSNSRAQKLFRTSSSYFLLLLLRPFPCSNCRRSLLLTFTSVFTQQLSKVLTSYFYVRFRATTVGGAYFLLLRPFPRSNCQRSLLLTFTSVFTQQLSKVLTSYFYVRFRATTAIVNGGDIFGIWRVGEDIWVRFFWAKGLGGS